MQHPSLILLHHLPGHIFECQVVSVAELSIVAQHVIVCLSSAIAVHPRLPFYLRTDITEHTHARGHSPKHSQQILECASAFRPFFLNRQSAHPFHFPTRLRTIQPQCGTSHVITLRPLLCNDFWTFLIPFMRKDMKASTYHRHFAETNDLIIQRSLFACNGRGRNLNFIVVISYFIVTLDITQILCYP